jgi:hypothetical protein
MKTRENRRKECHQVRHSLQRKSERKQVSFMGARTNSEYRTMKKLLFGILIIILSCQPAFAAKTGLSELDGSDWQAWDEEKKVHFLSGFLLGSYHVIKQNEPAISKDDGSHRYDDMRKRLSSGQDRKRQRVKTATFSREEMILWGHYRASMIQKGLADYAVYDIKIGLLSKGVDELYRDSKNMKIRISDAVYAVKKQIKGASREDMERTLQDLRGDP